VHEANPIAKRPDRAHSTRQRLWIPPRRQPSAVLPCPNQASPWSEDSTVLDAVAEQCLECAISKCSVTAREDLYDAISGDFKVENALCKCFGMPTLNRVPHGRHLVVQLN
jgi:hypothetical protein